jgi:hypothetical protein
MDLYLLPSKYYDKEDKERGITFEIFPGKWVNPKTCGLITGIKDEPRQQEPTEKK